MNNYKHIPTNKVFEPVLHPSVYAGEQLYKCGNDRIPFYIIKDSKEWVKVETLSSIINKEYTILSFIHDKDSSIFNISTDKVTYRDGSLYPRKLEYCLSYYKIHSVRRESDGEVFTIGDIYNDCDSKNNKLISFDISYMNGLYLISDFPSMLKNCRKVKPKEWEITAFKDKRTDSVFNLIEDGGYSYGECWWSLPMALKKDFLIIYSVKRLSDGVEFKIGDKVKCWNGIKTIEFIYLTDSTYNGPLRFKMIGQFGCNKKSPLSGYTLNHIQKIEKLFTTEDGVDIYEGDNYFWFPEVRTNGGSEPFIIKEVTSCINGTNINFDKNNKVHNFSTKEGAEEYILMNKPCLSVNDIINKFTVDSNGNMFFNKSTLITLAKSKS